MNNQYWVNIKVNGVDVRLLATIIHMPYCGWRIEKLTFRGMVVGVAIHYTPSLLDVNEMASAHQQIEDQILSDKLEMELLS